MAGGGVASADPLANAPAPVAAPAAQPEQADAGKAGDHDSLQKWLTQNGLVRQVSSASSQATGLVVNALGFIGVRYRYGGHDASTGFDCSGFVSHVYQQTLGLVLPHNAAAQSHAGERVEVSQLQPGDLVFFNTLRHAFSHVGIYIGNGEFIHAPRPGQSIQIGSLASPYWAKRFNGARRVIDRVADPLPDAAADTTAPNANAQAPEPAATATLPATN